jgi:hypothetical protein
LVSRRDAATDIFHEPVALSAWQLANSSRVESRNSDVAGELVHVERPGSGARRWPTAIEWSAGRPFDAGRLGASNAKRPRRWGPGPLCGPMQRDDGTQCALGPVPRPAGAEILRVAGTALWAHFAEQAYGVASWATGTATPGPLQARGSLFHAVRRGGRLRSFRCCSWEAAPAHSIVNRFRSSGEAAENNSSTHAYYQQAPGKAVSCMQQRPLI